MIYRLLRDLVFIKVVVIYHGKFLGKVRCLLERLSRECRRSSCSLCLCFLLSSYDIGRCLTEEESTCCRLLRIGIAVIIVVVAIISVFLKVRIITESKSRVLDTVTRELSLCGLFGVLILTVFLVSCDKTAVDLDNALLHPVYEITVVRTYDYRASGSVDLLQDSHDVL